MEMKITNSFISPYTSNIIPVEPSSIEASSGLTEAVFSKQLLDQAIGFIVLLRTTVETLLNPQD